MTPRGQTTTLAPDPVAVETDQRALATVAPQEEQLTLSLLASTPDCVKLLSLDGRLTFMSFAGQGAMEIDDVSVAIGQYWWDLWPAKEADRLKTAVRAAGDRQMSEFVAFCPTAKGTPRWWAVTVSPVLGAQDEISQVLAVSRDVTDLVDRQTALEAALAESEMLRREVDHRVKNSLGLVSSILNMHARNTDNRKISEALRDAAMRVRTIASVHGKLYRTLTEQVPLDAYLSSLCDDIQLSIGGAITVDYSGLGTDPMVRPDVSLALGLIVAELTGNALRHADLGPDDRLDVSLTLIDDAHCVLSVRDTGRGLPPHFQADNAGMGMTVVQSMAAKIGGQLGWVTPPDGGTMFSIGFDL